MNRQEKNQWAIELGISNPENMKLKQLHKEIIDANI